MAVTLPVSGIRVNTDFDLEEIDARDAKERRAHLKPEGLGQFHGLDDVLEYTDRDFYGVRPVRPMVEEDVDVVVLGRGFDDIRIVEQAAGLRRDVVLESLPWCAVRYRVLHLSAAARGNGLYTGSTLHGRRRDSRSLDCSPTPNRMATGRSKRPNGRSRHGCGQFVRRMNRDVLA
jgi:hypothetical protein